MKKLSPPQVFRAVGLVSLAAIVSVQAILVTMSQPVSAEAITVRSLTLEANTYNGTTTGGSAPGGIVNHKFDFVVPTGTGIRSMLFEYCTTAADVGTLTCVAPTGIDANLASATGQPTGLGTEAAGFTGGTFVSRSASSYYIRYDTPTSATTNARVTLTINNVRNPAATKLDTSTPEPDDTTAEPNHTFFVRIKTFTTNDASGDPVDKGTVAASTATQIELDGTMPESLVFCAGATVPFIASTTIPDCPNATSGKIKFNQLFSPQDTAVSNSQMAASTNASQGYAITVNGTTLRSGTNQINPMNEYDTTTPDPLVELGTAYPSIHGKSQFGLNLRANELVVANGFPGASADVAPVSGDGATSNFKGRAANGYNVVNQFRYRDGEVVASSDFDTPGTAAVGTDAQIYTVSYIANVPGNLPAGDYSTTLTYICTPTY